MKKSLNKTQMVISGQADASSGDDSLQMVIRNRIPFLIPMEYEEIDSQIRLLYDISSCISFSESLDGARLSQKSLIRLTREIGACLEKLQEYLLDPRLLMLCPDCIFMNPETKGFFFCYNPFYQGMQEEDLQGLFERIIAGIDYEDQELVRMAYEMFMAVQEEHVRWKDVENILEKKKQNEPIRLEAPELRPERYRQLRSAEYPEWEQENDRMDEDDCYEEAEKFEERKKEGFFQNLRSYMKQNSIREILTDIDDGMILQKIREECPDRGSDAERDRIPAHVMEGTGDLSSQRIVLLRYPFYIGKLPGKSDYILDRDTVSRNHLCIIKDPEESGCCMIVDQKSRNGTYLNGKRIRPLAKERIRTGDHIRLADAEFVFR